MASGFIFKLLIKFVNQQITFNKQTKFEAVEDMLNGTTRYLTLRMSAWPYNAIMNFIVATVTNLPWN